jgi:choline dehydrogenase
LKTGLEVFERSELTVCSSNNMRKIFQRIERNNYLPVGTAGHGFNGYFQTNMTKPASIGQPVLGIAQAIAQNFSLSTNQTELTALMRSDANSLDPKRDFESGIWGLPIHAKANGERYSSRDYIQDTITKGFPLKLSLDSLATRVLFSNSTTCGGKPKATGVEFLQGKSIYKADSRYQNGAKGVLKTVIARKEVILSGGTFNTPQILSKYTECHLDCYTDENTVLSGIGPSAHLAQHNISLILDAPGVGQNMQDNQEMPIISQYTGPSSGVRPSPPPLLSPTANPQQFVQLFSMHTTPYSPDGERDMFVMQGAFAFRGFWPANQTNAALPQDLPGIYGMSMVKNHPQNRAGFVKLQSSDPQDMPEINFNLFEQGRATDLGAMKWTVNWARDMLSKARTAGVDIKTTEPDCKTEECDEEWITGQTFGHHPTGTAAIGDVLDARFRVKGVQGLRVVDASVFPRMPGIFPVVSVFMVSEKASEVVLEDARVEGCAV